MKDLALVTYRKHNLIFQRTTRSPLEELFSTNTSHGHTILYALTLDALEEDDFCHFEIMLEFLHNRVHFFIGGTKTYSMSTLDYSAFDPIFMIVHSSMDRIWVLWQVGHGQECPAECFAIVCCTCVHSKLPIWGMGWG